MKCWQVQGHLEPPIWRHAIWVSPFGRCLISPFGRCPDCPAVIRVHLCSYSPPQFCCHKLRDTYHNSCMCACNTDTHTFSFFRYCHIHLVTLSQTEGLVL